MLATSNNSDDSEITEEAEHSQIRQTHIKNPPNSAGGSGHDCRTKSSDINFDRSQDSDDMTQNKVAIDNKLENIDLVKSDSDNLVIRFKKFGKNVEESVDNVENSKEIEDSIEETTTNR